MLDEKKIVSLSDKVAKYQPELPFGKDITLLQLATHTSGLPRDPFHGFILNAPQAIANFNDAEYRKFLHAVRTPLKVGKVRYSNIGMALLGNILAERLGTSYEDAVRTFILGPLGMNDTYVSANAYEAKCLVRGHNGQGNEVSHFHWCCMEPAGVWRSTTKDMLKFLKAHLGYAGPYWKKLLDRTTSPTFVNPKSENVALAWQLVQSESIGNVAWHNGQTLGQKAMVVCAKDKDCAIVILSNKVPKLWQSLFSGYSIERLGFDIVKLLVKSKGETT